MAGYVELAFPPLFVETVTKVIILLGQCLVRNIWAAFCIAWSPWERWTTLDMKTQRILEKHLVHLTQQSCQTSWQSPQALVILYRVYPH